MLYSWASFAAKPTHLSRSLYAAYHTYMYMSSPYQCKLSIAFCAGILSVASRRLAVLWQLSIMARANPGIGSVRQSLSQYDHLLNGLKGNR